MEEIQNSEKLDARWFKRFEDVFFEDYEKLTGHKEKREAEKNKFLAGDTENPTLDYPELESFNLDEREADLLSLKEDILELEHNEFVKKLYRTRINELLATLRMLRATKNGDDRKFSRYADFIYGKPGAGEVGYIVEHVKELIAQNIENENQEKRQAAGRLQEIFNELKYEVGAGVDKSILPAEEDNSRIINSIDEVVEVFRKALQEIGADDWKIEVDDPNYKTSSFAEFVVVVDEPKGLEKFSVSQEEKIAQIPSQDGLKNRNLLKSKLTENKLKAVIEHEIKTHAARRINGERSRLQLLGLGLDRSHKAEEGIATYAEQQITGASEFAGIPRFLSVALAKGLSGEKLDFRRTHSIMSDYRFLSSTKENTTPEQAQVIAYDDCVRIFRGTTCDTPGTVYSKDMAYFENRAIWTLVSKNSDVVKTFAAGKYDPNNSVHVALLSQLGILDSDLKKLEDKE
ncbi:DUF1704 domain-containing protein [Candidatus Kaiserbacteria bacterium]|nr:DUF1704 domain-containing protein [Candidatus Kaiserbacteria bacterium]